MRKRKLGMAFLCLFLITIGCKFIYGRTSTEIINHFKTGFVDIDLVEYQKDENGNEVLWSDESLSYVTAGDMISRIPRVCVRGSECYIRARVVLSNEDGTDSFLSENVKIHGMDKTWIQAKDGYFYYKEPLFCGDEIDVFQAVSISEDFPKNMQGRSFSMDVDIDAIQSDNFNPNFEAENPWGKVEIIELQTKTDNHISYFQQETVFEIVYKGESEKLIANHDDFFVNIPSLMPGDIYSDTISFVNDKNKDIRIYFRNIFEEDVELLKNINLKIITKTNHQEEIIYDGALASRELKKDIILAVISEKSSAMVLFELSVPNELGNAFAGLDSSVRWVFSTEAMIEEDEEDIDNENPDNENNGILDSEDSNDGETDIFDKDEISIGSESDLDRDGIVDRLDKDDDNDGISDIEDPDDDNDGILDAEDSDDDNDGVLDKNEINGGMNSDLDRDGISDRLDSDDDNDGIPDIEDSDDDNDGILDMEDDDDDNDGIPDREESYNSDLDEDGIVDRLDPDDDNDGILDAEDPDDDNDGILDIDDWDDDNDGFFDLDDSYDSDLDKDGIPDRWDTDDDNDGIPNTEDVDDDNDGILDDEDPDDDGDGVHDLEEKPGNGIFFEKDDTDSSPEDGNDSSMEEDSTNSDNNENGEVIEDGNDSSMEEDSTNSGNNENGEVIEGGNSSSIEKDTNSQSDKNGNSIVNDGIEGNLNSGNNNSLKGDNNSFSDKEIGMSMEDNMTFIAISISIVISISCSMFFIIWKRKKKKEEEIGNDI